MFSQCSLQPAAAAYSSGAVAGFHTTSEGRRRECGEVAVAVMNVRECFNVSDRCYDRAFRGRRDGADLEVPISIGFTRFWVSLWHGAVTGVPMPFRNEPTI